MASSTVSSRGRSPHSPYDLNSDTDESWQYLEYASTGSAPGSIGFLPSPASGSLNGYALVGHVGGGPGASPTAASPLFLDVDQQQHHHHHHHHQFSATTLPEQADAFSVGAADSASFGSGPEHASGEAFMTPQDLLLTDAQMTEIVTNASFFGGFPPNMPLADLGELQQTQPNLGISQALQSDVNVPAWDPTQMKSGQFVMEHFTTPTSESPTTSSSSPDSLGNRSPPIKAEAESKTQAPIRRVKVGKVEKRRPQMEQAGKFVIVTPNSISARAGRPNPFECFEALRTQRGRKGPLANETKESALQVRRLGACFCCHARKVKCDKERPCKSCKKLMVHVPQVVCWQFQDFIPVLFPEFIRGHFRKDEMTKFVTDNIEGFTVNGAAQPCTVQLFSGPRFETVLTLRAKFFTAKTTEVLQHWHMHVAQDRINLHSQSAAPIGIEFDNSAMKDEIKKRSKEYIQSIMKEPAFAEQLTDSFRHTDLPRRLLHIVQNFAIQSEHPIVRKALSVYTSHYIMTRHLCLTRQTIVNLQHTNLVAQNLPWVTPRVLNRQVKAVIDEITLKEMTQLFEHFSKSLKPKCRKFWAPCLAAFLVLCLFMESVETAADNFVISQAEINLQKHYAPEFQRDQALSVNKEIERLPFKQFAYQFHQIYQTHSKDASTKPFNPLVDDSFAEQGELDAAAIEMVHGLRQFLQGPSWGELDFLTADPILPNQEHHPFPRDVSLNYTGRLVSKFLLSFTDERYIFEGEF